MSESIEEQVLQLVLELDRAQAKNLAALSVTKGKIWTVDDAKRVETHYAKLLSTFPTDFSQACDWGEAEEQERLLSDLILIGDLNGKRILDLGCGPGGLLELMQKNKIDLAHYVGVDYHEQLLQAAWRRFPQNTWILGDCFELKSAWLKQLQDEKFDYVFASGLFGIRPRNWTASEFNACVLQVLQHFFTMARMGLAFNVIPENYPILRNALQLKADTELISYHRMDRLKLEKACENLQIHCRVKTLPPNLERLLVQFPLFLIKDPN